ncbi:Uncharacterised protein [Mycobacteroides abscessus subsp. abscessus]|nr:Uncharacterised protein [Mycobacteroides abscessus subsp. abscessus]
MTGMRSSSIWGAAIYSHLRQPYYMGNLRLQPPAYVQLEAGHGSAEGD